MPYLYHPTWGGPHQCEKPEPNHKNHTAIWQCQICDRKWKVVKRWKTYQWKKLKGSAL